MRRAMIVGMLLVAGLVGCGNDDDPGTSPNATGSCCSPAGVCTVTTRALCSGTWVEAGVCNPNPCAYLPQSSAANVLANLQRAYQERKIAEYRKLFSDDFTFVFNPLDPRDPDHPNPSSWDLVDEIEATQNMFIDTLVTSVELSNYSMGVPERADSLYYGPDAWKVRIDEVNLQVATVLSGGDPLTLVVQGTTETFFFRKDFTRQASDGNPTWLIFRWEDQPIGGGKVESTSWGQIKGYFWN